MDETENKIRGTLAVLLEQRKQQVALLGSVRERINNIDGQINDCIAAARIFNIELSVNIPETDKHTIKTIVLKQLREHPEGFFVSTSRGDIEREYGRPVHHKTIGVALARLRTDGLACLKGHAWYPVATALTAGQQETR